MLSVVIPVYNEGAVLEKTASVIRGVLSDAAIGCELIFVDDGSKDTTWEKITALSASGGIRGLHFSRNFGKEAAILAGLAAAKGDCCVVIDGDLQHPPEKIVETAIEKHVPLVGLSALMTTTVPSMEETIAQLRKSAPWVKVMVGGAVLTEDYARTIGADRYCKDAMASVNYAEEVIGG